MTLLRRLLDWITPRHPLDDQLTEQFQ